MSGPRGGGALAEGGALATGRADGFATAGDDALGVGAGAGAVGCRSQLEVPSQTNIQMQQGAPRTFPGGSLSEEPPALQTLEDRAAFG